MRLKMMFTGDVNVGKTIIIVCILTFFVDFAQAGNCEYMANMAKDAASLREAGVPIAVVEARLRRDVLNPDELALGLTVARLVYSTRGTPQQLKNEVLKKCK